jgi:leucyl-tRNA synthetase
MSKSRGNVINPDEVVRSHGADSLRLYEMFMGPLQQVKPWSMKGVEGVHRFLNRVWRLMLDEETGERLPEVQPVPATSEQLRELHMAIRQVTQDVESMSFNTAISAMMIFVNTASKWSVKPVEVLSTFVLLLSPFAPHIAEELWQRLGHNHTLAYEPWPEWKEDYLQQALVEIPVQVNGKVRARIQVAPDAGQEEVSAIARKEPSVVSHVEGKTIRREIFVPGRLFNLVVG